VGEGLSRDDIRSWPAAEPWMMLPEIAMNSDSISRPVSSECELERSQQASYRRSQAIPSSNTCQEDRYVA